MSLLRSIERLFNSNDSANTLYESGYKYYEERKFEEAADLWIKAANKGLAEAQHALGLLYENGDGVEKSIDKALKWYNKAAEQGHEEAQKSFNSLFHRQRFKITTTGTSSSSRRPYNETEKKVIYSPDKQFALGEKCYYGRGVEKSYEKAIEWYEKAANQGHAEAQCSLGYMFSKGIGVKQNYIKAAEWYKKAANQGYAKGLFNLGTIYYNGRGVPKDIEKAKTLFDRAAKKGDTDAQTILSKLNKSSEKKYRKVTDDVAQSTLSLRDRAQKSQQLFYQAQEQKRNGQYQLALKTYKQAYEIFPEDQDLQSTMYAMAKIYLLLGDYEKACTLFQDGLTQKLAQHDERTAKFYKNYMESQCYGGMSEADPDYIWLNDLTADYAIFIGLTHLMLENNGAALLLEYKTDFDNHIKSVAGKKAAQPSWSYLKTCYNYGWSRVIGIASESYNRCFDKIDLGYVQRRKQEFLDILETI
ncbi:MAG: tetratricopeptide repeat protein [Lachnospiraceae bacterium]|nr:tetratricopeptide repeat protein [Lachnospiraceae bacterium]